MALMSGPSRSGVSLHQEFGEEQLPTALARRHGGLPRKVAKNTCGKGRARTMPSETCTYGSRGVAALRQRPRSPRRSRRAGRSLQWEFSEAQLTTVDGNRCARNPAGFVTCEVNRGPAYVPAGTL